MKVIILAGGLPSTLIEEDEKMPKPMAEIGGRPILWHIMKQYAYYGYNDFIICTGYKGDVIKEYFINFYIYQSDITVDLQTNEVEVHRKQTEDWRVSIVDTGRETPIIERLYMMREYIGQKAALVSYGDCLSDIDLGTMVEMHKKCDKIATFAVAHGLALQQSLPMTLIDCLDQQKGIQLYRHKGFWSPVETVRDKTWLEGLWTTGQAPWKVWKD